MVSWLLKLKLRLTTLGEGREMRYTGARICRRIILHQILACAMRERVGGAR